MNTRSRSQSQTIPTTISTTSTTTISSPKEPIGNGLLGKHPLNEIQKTMPITRPTFIINCPILRDKLKGQNITLDSFDIYTLENPAFKGIFQKYMLIDYQLYEIHTVSPPNIRDLPHARNSKFIGLDYIESNATYFLSTPVDIMFMLLPHFLTKFKSTMDNNPCYELKEILFPTSSTILTSTPSLRHSQSTSELHHTMSTTNNDNSNNNNNINDYHSSEDVLTQKTNFTQLYLKLYENATIQQRKEFISKLDQWCDVQETTINDNIQYYFRLNFTKLENILKLKIARVCAQITATPSLQSLTITPNPDISPHQDVTPSMDKTVELTDITLHALALPPKHFKNVTKSWDETCSIIYSNAFKFLAEYLPKPYLAQFIQLYRDHNDEQFSIEMMQSYLNPKKAKRQTKTAASMLEFGDDDPTMVTNAPKSNTTATKRTASTQVADKTKKTKANPTPTKGQPSIMKFFSKKE